MRIRMHDSEWIVKPESPGRLRFERTSRMARFTSRLIAGSETWTFVCKASTNRRNSSTGVTTRRRSSSEPHHVLPDSGWVSFYLTKEEDVARAVALLQRSYELAPGAAGKEIRRTRSALAVLRSLPGRGVRFLRLSLMTGSRTDRQIKELDSTAKNRFPSGQGAAASVDREVRQPQGSFGGFDDHRRGGVAGEELPDEDRVFERNNDPVPLHPGADVRVVQGMDRSAVFGELPDAGPPRLDQLVQDRKSVV